MQQQILPGQLPTMFGGHYVGASVPTLAYSPYLASGVSGLVSPLLGNDQQTLINHQQQQQQQQQPAQPQLQQQSKPRSDRIEALPAGGGVMPYKRPASEKSGVPVYQPAGVQQQQQQQQQQLQQQQAAYHQIIQLQQQQQGASIVPVTYGTTALTIPRYQ